MIGSVKTFFMHPSAGKTYVCPFVRLLCIFYKKIGERSQDSFIGFAGERCLVHGAEALSHKIVLFYGNTHVAPMM